MRVGALCRMDFTGLGIQSKEFFDHIPCKALVIDSTKLSGTIQNPHWYPGQKIFKIDTWLKIPIDVINEFLNDIDILITFETPYDYSIFDTCRKRGIKTVLQLNYEFLEYPSKHPLPDLFAAPSLWNYELIPTPKMFLPVPVNVNHSVPDRQEKTFLHIAGRTAVHDRNGTLPFLRSLQYVNNRIKVIVRGQHHITLPRVPSHVKLIQDFTNKENYLENYTGGVLVMPRKYGGLCLPAQESIGFEMPVIMTDISPNNTWLPKEWLVPAHKGNSFKCKTHVDIYEVDERQLGAKIDEFCDSDFYNKAVEKAKGLKERISWEKLLPTYQKLFEIQ